VREFITIILFARSDVKQTTDRHHEHSVIERNLNVSLLEIFYTG